MWNRHLLPGDGVARYPETRPGSIDSFTACQEAAIQAHDPSELRSPRGAGPRHSILRGPQSIVAADQGEAATPGNYFVHPAPLQPRRPVDEDAAGRSGDVVPLEARPLTFAGMGAKGPCRGLAPRHCRAGCGCGVVSTLANEQAGCGDGDNHHGGNGANGAQMRDARAPSASPSRGHHLHPHDSPSRLAPTGSACRHTGRQASGYEFNDGGLQQTRQDGIVCRNVPSPLHLRSHWGLQPITDQGSWHVSATTRVCRPCRATP